MTFSFAEGTYTGDGGASKAITCGFAPVVVIVKEADTLADAMSHAKIRNTSMTQSATVTSANTRDDGILSLTSTGFTVKDDGAASTGKTNQNTGTYYWYAFGGTSVIAGSYTGENDGTDQSITGLSGTPVMVWVLPTTGALRFRTTDMGTEDYDFGVGAGSTTSIKTLDSNGFTVGTTLNGSGTYYYIAFMSDASLHIGHYNGDDANDRSLPASAMSFDPSLVSIKGNLGQEHRWKTLSLAGDAAFQYGDEAAVTDRIQSLTISSGKFQIGTNPEVNLFSAAPGIDYYFFAAQAVIAAQTFIVNICMI